MPAKKNLRLSQKNIIIVLGIIIALLLFISKSPFSLFLKPFENYQFLSNLKDKIVKENWLVTDNYTSLTIEKDDGKYAGLDWLTSEGDIELLSGYYLSYNPFGNVYTTSDENIVDGAKKIVAFLEKQGFKENSDNTFYQDSEAGFWSKNDPQPGRLAMEKGEIKCILTTRMIGLADSGFNLACNDISKSTTPQVYKEIYRFANPDKNLNQKINIDKVVGDYAVGGISGGMGGAATLWKKQAGQWEVSQVTQMGWDCQKLLDNKVPPELIKSCLFYGQGGGDIDYAPLYNQQFGNP